MNDVIETKINGLVLWFVTDFPNWTFRYPDTLSEGLRFKDLYEPVTLAFPLPQSVTLFKGAFFAIKKWFRMTSSGSLLNRLTFNHLTRLIYLSMQPCTSKLQLFITIHMLNPIYVLAVIQAASQYANMIKMFHNLCSNNSRYLHTISNAPLGHFAIQYYCLIHAEWNYFLFL